MEKLKPCPFCGQDGHGENRVRIHRYKDGHYRVICGKCGAASMSAYVEPWHDTKFVAQGHAVTAWNCRVSDSVKRGHWIRVDDTKCRCSVCDDTCLIAQYRGSPNFCPNCGAVMDGERETL